MTKRKTAKKESDVGQIKVIQVKSPIGRPEDQRKTLVGLGLNKMHKVKLLENTPAVMGMVNKVKHLVKFEIL